MECNVRASHDLTFFHSTDAVAGAPVPPPHTEDIVLTATNPSTLAKLFRRLMSSRTSDQRQLGSRVHDFLVDLVERDVLQDCCVSRILLDT